MNPCPHTTSGTLNALAAILMLTSMPRLQTGQKFPHFLTKSS